MSLFGVQSKKLRKEEDWIHPLNKQKLPGRLPSSLLLQTFSYLNIHDVISVCFVCKSFKILPSLYLRSAPARCQQIWDYCFQKNRNSGLSILSDSWSNGFNSALSLLKKFSLIPVNNCGLYLPPIADDHVLRIITHASSLNSLSLNNFSQSIFEKVVTTLKLIELRLELRSNVTFLNNTTSPLEKLWTNRSLKKLTIISYLSGVFVYEGSTSPLPCLEDLTLDLQTEDFAQINKLISRFTSLKKLDYKNSVLTNETIINLPNLQELVLTYPYPNTIPALLFASSLVNLRINYGPLGFHNHLFALYPILNDLKQLKQIYFNYFLQNDTEQFLKKLIDSGIASLSNTVVFLNVSENTFFLFNANFSETLKKIKNLILNIDIAFSTTLSLWDLMLIDEGTNSPDMIKHQIAIIKSISTIQEMHINLCKFEEDSFDEDCLIEFFKVFSDQVYSVLEKNDDFVWTSKLLNQLKSKPLENCKELKGRFELPKNVTLAEFYSFFPKLTPNEIIRKYPDQFLLEQPKNN